MKSGLYRVGARLFEYDEGRDYAYNTRKSPMERIPIDILKVLGEYECTNAEYWGEDEEGNVCSLEEFEERGVSSEDYMCR